MPRQVRGGRFVDTASRVYIDSIDNVVRHLPIGHQMLRLVLTRGGQQKASIRGKGQPPEEGRQGLVGVDA